MATVTATLTGLRIEDQSLAFTVTVAGDPGGIAQCEMVIYDAAGSERERTNVGMMAPGQHWDARLDLPAASLPDGDYGVWVYIDTATADEQPGPKVEQGVSFLVGRGRIYPSREQADKRTLTLPPTLSPLRLEGSWIVFDMTNHQTFDIEVAHQLDIAPDGSGNYQRFYGKELVRAGATQQGHYLLPELADGRYVVFVNIQNEGSDLWAPSRADIQVDGNVITMIPTP